MSGLRSLSTLALMIPNLAYTRAARAIIAQSTSGGSGVGYWLDIGNNASSGQFILGEPRNVRNKRLRTRLRTVGELFSEVADPALDADDEPSCSAAEALDRQEPFVNAVLTQQALALLARLFRYGELFQQGAFVDIASSTSVPIKVSIYSAITPQLNCIKQAFFPVCHLEPASLIR